MTSAPSHSSEELSDSETPSAIGLCIQDDKEFIRNGRARTMVDVGGAEMIKGGGRVALLWSALRWLPNSLRTRVLLELLQGSDDGEDVWLWNEGDEALIELELFRLRSPPPWTSAVTILERCFAQTPPRRTEVQSATFEMRTAMICWLALISTAYKSADEERGGRNREEWDMRELITLWWYSLPRRVDQWLAQHIKSYDDRGFTEAMEQAGHSCHRPREKEVTCWLLMRCQLSPTRQDRIIYLGDAHKPTRRSESPPSWTPSPALVALRCIWDNIEENYDFSEWLQYQPIYGFKEANDFLSSLPRDTDEDRYLSWVNEYPADVRYTVTRYPLAEWKAMDDCLTGSARGGSLTIRSWCAVMLWTMMRRELSYPTRVGRFIHALCYSDLCEWDFLPPLPPAAEFRDAIRDSGHRCWEEKQINDYAAARAFLNEEAKVVGIDVQKDSICQVCRLQWRLKDLGETLPGEEQGAFDDPQGWINGRKIACVDSSKMICKLPLGLIYVYSLVIDTDSIEYSDLTLALDNNTTLTIMS
ncbi:hypothetical protein C8J56DRAFT_1026868, partial [Mycena floridula]